MPRSTPFILPRGASMSLSSDRLLLRHDGDMVLEQTLGRQLSRAEATGDITLRLDRTTGTVIAGGVLTVEGPVDGIELRGRRIRIEGVEVRCRAIVATERVEIGAADLAVDVIVAPEIIISPEATGRVTIMDCEGARPATRVRGGWSVQDYEAEIGGASDFLAARGVTPLQPLDEPAPQAAPVQDAAEAPPPRIKNDGAPVPARTAPRRPAEAEPRTPPRPAPPEPPAVPSFAHPPGAVRGRLRKAMLRIDREYRGQAVPRSVELLRDLADAGEYDRVAAELDGIWCDVLRDHVRRKNAPPRGVVQAFLSIHALRA